MTSKTETIIENGTEIFVPLNKLKKSPRNARKTPHSEAHIEALAASFAVKGMLQNLVVEPERDGSGEPTGSYYVTIGEGRRLAHLLRAKRKEIKKTEPIRCILDTANDPEEISLDENVNRETLHPADEFERFRELAENRGWGAEEIAARFGKTPQVVRQRLRLGAVSPRLMQVYREGGLTLDQLMAFAISEDHARQEQVYDNLSWNKEPHVIRRMMIETHVRASDRRALFVGKIAYTEAGGVVLRDLFSEDDGGYFEDAALLDRLAVEKLQDLAENVRAEGWKWVEALIDFPHTHGLRRLYPRPTELSSEDQTRLDAVQSEFDALNEEYDGAEEVPDEIDVKLRDLEAEIDRLSARHYVYDRDAIARSGVFVVLHHDGTPRIERGFVRKEDDAAEPQAEAEKEHGDTGDKVRAGGERPAQEHLGSLASTSDENAEESKTLSDVLVRDLTAHRTLGLRLALGERPDVALIAVTHALAARHFYRGHDTPSCLDLTPVSTSLGGHAEGVEDTEAGKLLTDRHGAWAAQMPQDAGDLWDYVARMDHDSRMSLFAHCAALTLFAVTLPWDRKPRALATADRLAQVLALDMTAHWRPTVRSYLGRVTKAQIVDAVRDGVSEEAAQRLAGLKKQAMAESAEQLLIGTGWLPDLLRTAEVAEPSTPNRDEQSAQTAG